MDSQLDYLLDRIELHLRRVAASGIEPDMRITERVADAILAAKIDLKRKLAKEEASDGRSA